MGFCTKPGGSDDKLWMESLPGGSKENPIIHNNPTCSWCSFLLCGTGGGMLGGDRAASSAGVCWALHSCGWGVSARLWVSCRHSVLSQGCVQGSLHSAPVQGCAPAACCGHRDIHHHFQPVALGDTGGFCGLGVSVSGQSGSSPHHALLSPPPDKTVKLWKVSERDKRPEGYNLKDEDGRLRDPSMITVLRVSAGAHGGSGAVPCRLWHEKHC